MHEQPTAGGRRAGQPPRPLAEVDAELTAPGGPFEIDVVDIRGVPTRVWRHAPATLGDILVRSLGFGDRDMLVYEGERTTYAEHFSAAAAFAAALTRRGVARGDRVAIAMRNLPEWSVAFWGAAAAGAVVVTLNAWWTAEELAYGLADSGARVVVVDPERAVRLAGVRAGLGDLDAVVVVRAGPAGPGSGEAWEDLLAGSGPADLPDPGVGPDDDATIFYTSGTTGEPKGVVGTHRNICSNPVSSAYVAARAAARWGHPVGAPPAGRPATYLLSVPLFHATGCHSLLVGHTYHGATIVMMHRWDPARALELIEQERVTSFGGVPTMALQVLDHPDLARRDTSSLTAVRYGGAPAPPELAGRIAEALGTPAMNGWGMTETSALATMHVGEDHVARPDSVGPPVPVVELRVTDAGGAPLPPGEVGELQVRGPTVVRGYWRKPDATAAAFHGGWLRTGDLGRLDEEGFLTIVDRAKDMVIRGGENVYCLEVEGVLHEHPAVAEAAVVGIPHPTLGEEVAAVVALLPGRHADEGELRDFAAGRLAPFKVPSRVWVRGGELPRNPAGKLLKRQLRDEVTGA